MDMKASDIAEINGHLYIPLEKVAKESDLLQRRVMPADCGWQTDFDYFGDDRFFTTNCGEAFFIQEGTSGENNYNYCPKCGGKIKQA